MIEVGKKSKITIHWKVSPYDYSKDKLNTILSKASKKYSIPKDRIRVIPDFIMEDESGEHISINNDIVQNIQDPAFQVKLFEEYLKTNNIEGYDFNLIKKIDSEINGKIDYQVYDKYCRYSIKWIRWDNFLSYGTGNYFDFSSLKDFVLLTGKPSNQSGKTTFAIDLIHFLLFGKTDKADVQSKIFNKHIPDATNVIVEGCICINGSDYIIKRTLSRPSLEKRTDKSKVTQKVEYYKIVGSDRQELSDYIEDMQEESSVQTNKVIKEAIGRESDFDLVMSITETNLDALIEKKDTERGRLLSRWIGLLPIEEKDSLAREKFNTEIKPYLLSNTYNSETLKQECDELLSQINLKTIAIKTLNSNVDNLNEEIDNLEKNKETLLLSKLKVDENLLNVDIMTLTKKIENLTNEGLKKKSEVGQIDVRLNEIGEVEFSVEAYDKEVQELTDLKEKRGSLLEKHKTVKHNIEHLKTSEYCPVCKRKLDNVDNSEQIKELEEQLNAIVARGKKIGEEIVSKQENIESMKENRDLYNEKSKLTMTKTALQLSMSKLREELRDARTLLNDYRQNSDAIDKNNELSIQIRNNDIHLNNKRNQRDNSIKEINNNELSIKSIKEEINNKQEIIKKIHNEEKIVKNWKIYLELVGKNGISKMVFRKTLPIINARLTEMLSDVCDFDVEVGINAKNDVMFYLIKDGVKSDLYSGSGFERTAASLALRSVLSDLSTVPKNNGVLLDEIWGRTSKENYDNLMNLLKKISKSYDYMFIITHNDDIKAYCTTNVIVEKSDNISKINVVS